MQITFIGLGEAASAIISGWAERQSGRIAAYDIKLDDPATRSEITDRAAGLGITLFDTADQAIGRADLVICTVTADQAVVAATSGAPSLNQGAIWCDLNSCAPASKRRSAEAVESAGGRYVDVAVLAPVHPKLNMVPCLLSGPHAADVAPLLSGLPMEVREVGDEVGRASAIKMIRSVVVKGLEALTAECTLAAVAAGVEEEVVASLLGGQWEFDLAGRAGYNFERSLRHGVRRAAEMDEVAVTLADLGLPNGMAAATADWERRIAGSGVPAPGNSDGNDFREIAADLLPVLRRV